MLEFLDKPLLEMGAYNAPLWLVWNFACPAQEVFCLAFSNWFKERGLLDQENMPSSSWFKNMVLKRKKIDHIFHREWLVRNIIREPFWHGTWLFPTALVLPRKGIDPHYAKPGQASLQLSNMVGPSLRGPFLFLKVIASQESIVSKPAFGCVRRSHSTNVFRQLGTDVAFNNNSIQYVWYDHAHLRI